MKKHFRLLMQTMWVILFITSCSKSEIVAPEIIVPATKESPHTTRTPKPTLTFTPTPDFHSLFFQPRDSKELQDYVVFNINQGRTVTEINTFFDQSDRRQVWIDGITVDFDGDGVNELFLTTSFYPKDQDKTENSFLVAKKTQERFSIAYSKNEMAFFIPKIEFVDNFNGDNLPDLIFTRPVSGNGSGADLFVVRQEKSGINISHVGETELIIDKLFASDNNADRTKSLVIVGFESGWASSGPGRTIEEIYSVSNEKYGLIQSNYVPDNYRIHVLQDAQIAYDSGNEELAVELWKQAAHDQTLENFPSMRIENDVPEKYQPAFAVYRLYTYFLSENDKENAQIYWMELNNKYPEGSPGGEFISLATEAKRLLDDSKDTNVVCSGIYEFLNSTNENVNFLMQHWFWGDHNLDIVDFCPLRR